jgi:hypothetical protein
MFGLMALALPSLWEVITYTAAALGAIKLVAETMKLTKEIEQMKGTE